MLCRCIAQHVVKTFAAGRVLFKSQACRPGWQPDHLSHFTCRWWQQVVLTIAFLQRDQFSYLANRLVEVAAQRSDHPDASATRQSIKDVDKRFTIILGDFVLGVHLLHLVNQQREPRIGFLAILAFFARQRAFDH